MIDRLSRIVIVTGHYGSGKTNLSLNLALALREHGQTVTLADLDIVNPYFRSADFAKIADRHGIELIVPNFANSNLDSPSLPPALSARIEGKDALVIDVGGDDAGAFALGRYATRIARQPYSMLYVVNRYRYLTREPEEAVGMLREIETASRLRATGIVNNSNLGDETTAGDLTGSLDYARRVGDLAGAPLLATAVPRGLYGEFSGQDGYFPVDIYVKTPWQR